MGTSYHITVVKDVYAKEVITLQDEIDSLLEDVNETFSTYSETSEVSLFNKDTGLNVRPQSVDFITVLKEALYISEVTQGAYDITVGPLVNLWGFGPDFNKDSVPTDSEIEEVWLKTGYRQLSVSTEAQGVKKLTADIHVDFSSIAKGFGVDKVADLLDLQGFENYMVEIGGEMRVRGFNSEGIKWRIAVEKPDSSKRAIHKVINVTDIAMATSGDYRNYFEKDGVRFSHTINPATGKPVQHNLASVTVLAKKSMTADAWATAFMVLGDKKGYDLAIENNVAVLFLVKEGDSLRELMTPTFQRVIGDDAS